MALADSRFGYEGGSLISIVCPTLGRPHLLEPLAENIHETSTDFRLIFVCDLADLESQKAVGRAAQLLPRHSVSLILHDGTYPVKSNAGMRHAVGEWAVVVNDDTRFHAGWQDAVQAGFDAGANVVGTNDLSPSSHESHSTQVAVRLSYLADPGASWQEPGRLYHEGYLHNWSESEVCHLAGHRGCWAYREDAVIEHEHPDWGKRERDATDERGGARNFERDRRLYEARRELWSVS